MHEKPCYSVQRGDGRRREFHWTHRAINHATGITFIRVPRVQKHAGNWPRFLFCRVRSALSTEFSAKVMGALSRPADEYALPLARVRRGTCTGRGPRPTRRVHAPRLSPTSPS